MTINIYVLMSFVLGLAFGVLLCYILFRKLLVKFISRTTKADPDFACKFGEYIKYNSK